jgi:hypothetical protein
MFSSSIHVFRNILEQYFLVCKQLFGEKGTNEVGGIIFGFGKISVAFQPYK